MSLISRVSRSVLSSATFAIDCAAGASGPSAPAASRPREPRIEVSGVRSSWLTTETNSFFIRSTSRRWVMSRKTTTAPRTTSSSSRSSSRSTSGLAVISTGKVCPSART